MSNNNVTAKKDFLAQCTVCKAKLLNWSGSTPCCGALADIIWEGIFAATPPTVAEQKEVKDFGMAALLLRDKIIDLKQQEKEYHGRLNIATINEKAKAFLEKGLANVQGWIKQFEQAAILLESQSLPPTQPTEEKIGKREGGE